MRANRSYSHFSLSPSMASLSEDKGRAEHGLRWKHCLVPGSWAVCCEERLCEKSWSRSEFCSWRKAGNHPEASFSLSPASSVSPGTAVLLANISKYCRFSTHCFFPLGCPFSHLPLGSFQDSAERLPLHRGLPSSSSLKPFLIVLSRHLL